MQTDATLLANKTQHCWELLALVASVCMGLKTNANGRNVVGPNTAVTCCVRLHGTTTMLALVACSLKPIKLLAQQVQTFLLFCDRRSVAQQCCARLHGTPTMLAS